MNENVTPKGLKEITMQTDMKCNSQEGVHNGVI